MIKYLICKFEILHLTHVQVVLLGLVAFPIAGGRVHFKPLLDLRFAHSFSTGFIKLANRARFSTEQTINSNTIKTKSALICTKIILNRSLLLVNEM